MTLLIDSHRQGDPDAKTDDVRFTLDVLQKISQQYCIDLEKVYASGKSNGGKCRSAVISGFPLSPYSLLIDKFRWLRSQYPRLRSYRFEEDCRLRRFRRSILSKDRWIV